MFQDIPDFHHEYFPQNRVDLDNLLLSDEQKYYLRGSDLAKFYMCLDEIYHDCDDCFDIDEWPYYYIIRWLVQEGEIQKIKESIKLSSRARWMLYWIVIYWAWEENQYEIFVWAWYIYNKHHTDMDVGMVLLINSSNWPEGLRNIFRASEHCDTYVKIGFGKKEIGEAIVKLYPELN